jgi:hypothetical protein
MLLPQAPMGGGEIGFLNFNGSVSQFSKEFAQAFDQYVIVEPAGVHPTGGTKWRAMPPAGHLALFKDLSRQPYVGRITYLGMSRGAALHLMSFANLVPLII